MVRTSPYVLIRSGGPALLFSPLILNAFRLKVAQITAVSIETAFQNGGIAFILLQLSLPKPYGDIAAVAPVRQFIYYIRICIFKIS